MIVTEGVRDTFRKRSKVMSTIRHMLEQQDFLEIETPVLESTAGGQCCCVPCHVVPLLSASLQLQLHCICLWPALQLQEQPYSSDSDF